MPPTPPGQPYDFESLILVRAHEEKQGYTVLFDGRLENMNPALGQLLVVLAQNVPPEEKPPGERKRFPDQCVDWKSRSYLVAKLGITKGAAESRLRRLRRFLEQTFGEEMIAQDRPRNSRLRLRLRRNSGFEDRSNRKEES